MSRLELFLTRRSAPGSRDWIVYEAGNPDNPVFVGAEEAAHQEAKRRNDEAFEACREQGFAAWNNVMEAFDRQSAAIQRALEESAKSLDQFTAMMLASIQRIRPRPDDDGKDGPED